MLTSRENSAYQTAVAEGATQADLLQLVYMHLAKDFLRAAQAVEAGSIEVRCAASQHAFLLLGHLESWTDSMEEVELATSLRVFYQMLRTSLMTLQAHPSKSRFEQLAQFVLDASAAWRTRQQSLTSPVWSAGYVQPETAAISFEA